MFTSISWSAYWTVLSLLSGIYYVLILLFYFRKARLTEKAGESLSLHPFHPFSSGKEKQPLGPPLERDFEQPARGTLEHLAYTCIDELNAYIQEAKRMKVDKTGFLNSVRSILSKHPTLAKSEYGEAIFNVLQSEAAHHCAIHISKEEIDSVWFEM